MFVEGEVVYMVLYIMIILFIIILGGEFSDICFRRYLVWFNVVEYMFSMNLNDFVNFMEKIDVVL